MKQPPATRPPATSTAESHLAADQPELRQRVRARTASLLQYAIGAGGHRFHRGISMVQPPHAAVGRAQTPRCSSGPLGRAIAFTQPLPSHHPAAAGIFIPIITHELSQRKLPPGQSRCRRHRRGQTAVPLQETPHQDMAAQARPQHRECCDGAACSVTVPPLPDPWTVAHGSNIGDNGTQQQRALCRAAVWHDRATISQPGDVAVLWQPSQTLTLAADD